MLFHCVHVHSLKKEGKYVGHGSDLTLGLPLNILIVRYTNTCITVGDSKYVF